MSTYLSKEILIIFVVFLMSIPAVTAPVWYGSGDDSGLVLHIPCEGDFRDLSGQGNHGTQSRGVQKQKS